MFELATSRGIMAPLAWRGMKHRLSMFADDIMIFAKPFDQDLQACSSLQRIFGGASGLHVNLTRSATYPIRCPSDTRERVVATIGCPSGTFPGKFLGLPLTIHKQSSTQLSGLVDQLAAALPRCKAAGMSKSGRLLLVKSVLCAMPLHAILAWTYHTRRLRR